MQNFKRVARGLDTSALLFALRKHPQSFEQITIRQKYPGSAHADTRCIYIRGPKEFTFDAIFNQLDAIYNPELPDVIMINAGKLVTQVADAVGAREIGRVMIVELAPGGEVKPHADEGFYADHFERFHIVLSTNQLCFFQCDYEPDHAEIAHMKEGEAWWFNHKRTHNFINEGDTPRIHLIADMVAPSYRKERHAF